MKKTIFFVCLASLSLLALVVYQFLTLHDGKLHVVFCNVGQGDAILITTPNNKHILIDAGPDKRVLDCLANHMPFWERKIDIVILTHPHSDHFSGLYYVLEDYNVSVFATEALSNKTSGFQELVRIIADKHISQKFVYAGDKWRIGEVTLAIQGPTREFLSETSPGGTIGEGKEFANVITQVSYGKFDLLLTGDTQATALKDAALRVGKPVAVLQSPHHGSATGLNEEVLDLLQPDLTAISVGKNRYGHPTKFTLGLLAEKKIRVLRTDQEGDVEVVSDGKGWQVDELSFIKI